MLQSRAREHSPLSKTCSNTGANPSLSLTARGLHPSSPSLPMLKAKDPVCPPHPSADTDHQSWKLSSKTDGHGGHGSAAMQAPNRSDPWQSFLPLWVPRTFPPRRAPNRATDEAFRVALGQGRPAAWGRRRPFGQRSHASVSRPAPPCRKPICVGAGLARLVEGVENRESGLQTAPRRQAPLLQAAQNLEVALTSS